MRHQKNTVKLGRTSSQRKELLSGLVCELILRKRIKTTLPKARAARRLAERMVTLAKKDTLPARRLAVARLGRRDCVRELFAAVAPVFQDRAGGYTRVLKLPSRNGDNAQTVLLEWVDIQAPQKKKKAPEAEKEASPSA